MFLRSHGFGWTNTTLTGDAVEARGEGPATMSASDSGWRPAPGQLHAMARPTAHGDTHGLRARSSSRHPFKGFTEFLTTTLGTHQQCATPALPPVDTAALRWTLQEPKHSTAEASTPDPSAGSEVRPTQRAAVPRPRERDRADARVGPSQNARPRTRAAADVLWPLWLCACFRAGPGGCVQFVLSPPWGNSAGSPETSLHRPVTGTC